MKKYILLIVALLTTSLSFAQNTAIQQGTAPQAENGGNVDSIATLLIAIAASGFLFIIIFALSSTMSTINFFSKNAGRHTDANVSLR